MPDRNFVIMPLADILPDWQHPVLKKSVLQILKDAYFDNTEIKKLQISPL